MKKIEIAQILEDAKRHYPIPTVERIDYTKEYALNDIISLANEIGSSFISGFTSDEASYRFALENLCRWLIGDTKMMCHDEKGETIIADITKGIIIVGPQGSGKRTLLEVLCYIGNSLGIEFRTNGSNTKIKWEHKSEFNAVKAYNKLGFIGIKDTEHIIEINDIGSEKLLAESAKEMFIHLIDAQRVNRTRLLLLTTNLSLDEMASNYPSGTFDELMRQCNIILLPNRIKK